MLVCNRTPNISLSLSATSTPKKDLKPINSKKIKKKKKFISTRAAKRALSVNAYYRHSTSLSPYIFPNKKRTSKKNKCLDKKIVNRISSVITKSKKKKRRNTKIKTKLALVQSHTVHTTDTDENSSSNKSKTVKKVYINKVDLQSMTPNPIISRSMFSSLNLFVFEFVNIFIFLEKRTFRTSSVQLCDKNGNAMKLSKTDIIAQHRVQRKIKLNAYTEKRREARKVREQQKLKRSTKDVSLKKTYDKYELAKVFSTSISLPKWPWLQKFSTRIYMCV